MDKALFIFGMWFLVGLMLFFHLKWSGYSVKGKTDKEVFWIVVITFPLLVVDEIRCLLWNKISNRKDN